MINRPAKDKPVLRLSVISAVILDDEPDFIKSWVHGSAKGCLTGKKIKEGFFDIA